MKMVFRYFGDKDCISLKDIRQIPCVSGIVSALYDIKCGEVWPLEKINKLKRECEKENLSLEVIESVPVHEDIKLGLISRDKYIENYKQTIINLSKAGVKCICYNFMPVFDWLRTSLKYVNSDGSTSLRYDHEELLKLDKHNLSLPGWDESYSKEELNSLLEAYKNIDEKKLFENLVYFLNGIIPTCEEVNMDMAIHPDDPPWSIFSLPRIITNKESYEKLFKAVPNKHNGLTLCTGSLGAKRDNDLIKIIHNFSSRIFFAHIRQIKYDGNLNFTEAGHLSKSGDLDIYQIMKSLVDVSFSGYVRSDHGRNIWGEDKKPGYGLFDRALGISYLYGLYEGISKGEK